MDSEAFYSASPSELDGPMHGVRVLDITTAWAGPQAGCLLADLGCDVIHIDLPGSSGGSNFVPNLPGTSLSWTHQTVNRNKRSLTVDLRTPAGADVVLELLADIDIVVENFKPGTLSRWGIGFEQCRAVKPDIVYVSISGYGQFGPWSDQPGYDPATLAVSGWMSLNGEVDGVPTKSPTFLADDLAGLHAALASLAALRHRDRTGEGQHVDVSLFDSILYQSCGFPTLAAMGYEFTRLGNEVLPSVPANSYRCADGLDLYMGVALDSHWKILCRLIGQDELGDDERFATAAQRVVNRVAVNELLAAWFSTVTRKDALARCSAAGLVVAPVNTYAEAVATEHAAQRGVLVDVELSDGSVAPIVAPPVRFSRTRTRIRRRAPRIGEHTEEILREAGMGSERIADLRDAGVI
jgi:formyl-CoA transferase